MQMAQDTSGINDQDKLMAALAYVIGIIVPLIILLTESKNRAFQRYHAIQSLGLSAAIFVAGIVLCIVMFVIQLIPVLGQIISCLMFFVYLAPLAIMVYYAYKAYQGEYFVIPVVTDFLKQQKWL
jgi:uncharacterized membrane protein